MALLFQVDNGPETIPIYDYLGFTRELASSFVPHLSLN
jgi:hypothetical protein